ncbi:hypothetical protein MSSAC_1179 [Methanosarcina siciliae C2J]|uniref:Uncharacterized protein n=3 Tax=Methanosarcina siciliae TaxID=38027 RepID=A0A0E3PFQ0_9EURY|nr:hypothetical protein [Methanosarcina siciliae]AKB29525.1 hypothetical protein MSSIT_2806 [Methanosarcina siciliae T4/M]AKB33464.1 hypothetical protein MSSIH_2774 [Methanosarcina siciliae HI350]AKB35769.1 hypothetical protein MSSAC_1179 [Methanosarcina siciliae C2J]
MSKKDSENILGGPTAILLFVGVALSAILFYYMFKFADEENLFMVLVTTLMISIIAIAVARGLVYLYKHK